MSSATPPGPARRDRRIVAWPLAAAPMALAFLLALSPSAGAAIALVKNLGTNGNTTSGKTLAINPSSTVAVGDTVIVTFAMDPDSGTVSCADSKGNTYSKDADKTNGSGTSGVRTVIFSAPVTTALTTPHWNKPGASLPLWVLSWPAWYLVVIAWRRRAQLRSGFQTG